MIVFFVRLIGTFYFGIVRYYTILQRYYLHSSKIGYFSERPYNNTIPFFTLQWHADTMSIPLNLVITFPLTIALYNTPYGGQWYYVQCTLQNNEYIYIIF